MEYGRFTFCVAAVIENELGEILLLKRSPGNYPENIWDVVGGRKEQFEEPFEALSREILEETGLKEVEIMKMFNVFHWFQEESFRDMIGVTFWCKTKKTEVKLSDEHIEFRWVKLQEATKLAEHAIVKSILQDFLQEKRRL